MSKELTGIKLRFNCTANWDNMQQLDDCRFCSHCQKKVYDFTESKKDKYEQILIENKNSICGRFTTKQIVENPTIVNFWKRLISAAIVLFGFNFWAGQAVAQKVKHKHKKIRQVKFLPPPMVVMGDVEVKSTHPMLPQQLDTVKKANE